MKISDILKQIGPSLSSSVVEKLVASGISAEAARQRISRSGDNVRKLFGAGFPNRESFLYLDEQFQRPEYHESLSRSFIESKSSIGLGLVGLNARDGWIRANEFPIATGAPVKKAKGHTPHEFIEKKLLDFGLIAKRSTSDGEIFHLAFEDAPTDARRAAVVVENIVLSALKTWFIKMGWSSTNKFEVRGGEKNPEFGQFAWDFVSPTYLVGLRQLKERTVIPGFFAGDIILEKTVTPEMLRPFLSKCDTLAGQKRSTRFQPAFVAESFSPEALNLLRKRGCLICIPEVIFGLDAARNLRDLSQTIQHAAASVAKNPHTVFQLIGRMSKFEGAAGNLRGVVLEMFVARLFALQGYNIDIRKKIFNGSERAEIDVRAVNSFETVCCECKAKGAHVLVSADEVSAWYNKSFPRIRDWLKDSSADKKRRFEFISSTGYTEEARLLIQQIEAADRKSPIRFLTGDDVLERLKDYREMSLIEIFREQFVD